MTQRSASTEGTAKVVNIHVGRLAIGGIVLVASFVFVWAVNYLQPYSLYFLGGALCLALAYFIGFFVTTVWTL